MQLEAVIQGASSFYHAPHFHNKAKEKGVKFGAQRKLSDAQIEELREKRCTGVLIKNLMDEYKLSKASVYRYLEKTDSAGTE